MNEENLLQWSLNSTPSLEWMEWIMQIIWVISVVGNIFYVITFLLTAWGLYLINKKLWENHPWLAFIPIIQVWTYFTASQKSFLKYFVYPVIALIVWGILATFTYGITIFLALVYMVYCWVIVLHAISKRTGRGAWSTVWMFFVGWIMLPVIGTKLKVEDQKKPEKTQEEKDSISKEL